MNTKLTENAYLELHKFLVEHNLTYVYILIILISGLLFLLGWIISARKSNAEINKIKKESEGKSLENYTKTVELSKKIYVDLLLPYAQKMAVFQTQFDNLIEKLKYKEKKLIANSWDNVKKAFEDLLLNFLPYFDYIKRFGNNDDEKRDFVNNVALPFLKNISDFKNSVTSEEITQYIGFQNNLKSHIVIQIIDFSNDYIKKENKAKFSEYTKNLNN